MDTKIKKMNALDLDCLTKEELSSFIKTIYENIKKLKEEQNKRSLK